MQTLKMYTVSLNMWPDSSSFNTKKDYNAILNRAIHLRKVRYKVKFYLKVSCCIKQND